MPHGNNADEQLASLLDEFRRLLLFHKNIGLQYYPFPPALRKDGWSGPGAAGKSRELGETGKKRSGKESGQKSVVLSAAEQAAALLALEQEVAACMKCGLAGKRLAVQFGEGKSDADIFLLTEVSGAAEAKGSEVLTGEDRLLLEKMLAAVNLQMTDVYQVAPVKCRTADAGSPGRQEFAACLPFLLRQIETINPRLILVFGEKPAQLLLQSDQPLFHLRGKLHRWHGFAVLVSYHPSQLRSETALKRFAWQDLQLMQKELTRRRS